MGEADTIIRPQPGPQMQFLSSQADIAIYGGSAGGGKTWGLLMEPLRHIGNGRFGAVFFRRTTTQITNEGGLWDESAELYPLLGGHPRTHALEWRSPSRRGGMGLKRDDFRNLKNLARALPCGMLNTFAHSLKAMQMSKRANPMAVKAALTYEVNEAAATLGKTPATIRNWIKDGLPVMSSRKPYLISGAAIQEYLRAKYRAAKCPLISDQLYCPACRKGRRPVGMAVVLIQMTPKTALLKGPCDQCGGTSTRMISKAKAKEFAQTFKITERADSAA